MTYPGYPGPYAPSWTSENRAPNVNAPAHNQDHLKIWMLKELDALVAARIAWLRGANYLINTMNVDKASIDAILTYIHTNDAIMASQAMLTYRINKVESGRL